MTYQSYIGQDTSNLSFKIEQICSAPLLKPDQERELMARMKAGDAAAREQFLAANIRLVVNIAKRYRFGSMEMMDRIQEGCIGLMRAADLFDPSKGHKFSTYATWWIRQAIQRSIEEQANTIRIPVHLNELRVKALKIIDAAGDGNVTDEEIAAKLGKTPKQIRTALQANGMQPISFDAVLPDSHADDPRTLGNALAAAQPSIEDEVEYSTMREIIAAALKGLTDIDPRAAFILVRRHGLDGGEPHTLEEIGNELGITRERVRQIEAKALKALRHPAYGGAKLRTLLGGAA